MVRGSPPSGATIGGIERMAGAWNARPMPYRKAITNSGPTEVGPLKAYTASAIEQTSSPPTAASATSLRENRSATLPVTSTSSAAGRNSANPMKPMSASLPVRSNACFNSAVACSATPA
ncbi:unannotated protein [freshwater metagenome]|uniref:Unannotated protein n=1 Tax=freshwater metagenome TaxID=449393 RepID=A0A6J6GL11_9ZZZZ